MADDEGRGSGAAPAQVLGAQPFIDDGTMEDVLFKLKLLNYETEFIKLNPSVFKPLNRSYFAVASDNTSIQFFYFASLSSWLMTMAGSRDFPAPGQFDDPGATITNLLSAMRALDVASRDIAPTRLRGGNGDAVLTVLTLLVDKALIARGFTFRTVEYPADSGKEAAAEDADDGGLRASASAAVGADSEAVDDHIALDSDSDDDAVFVRGGGASNAREEEDYITPQVSADAWKLEVERVAPVLQYRTDDAKDWRSRVENARTLYKAVEKMYPDIKNLLERMGDDIQKACERIQKREQTLASQFQEHVEDYRTKLRELTQAQDQANEAGKNVSQLSAELNAASEQLEGIKAQIQEREEKSSDIAPLVRMKESLAKVRSEIKEMSLRIGILQHTTLQFTLRQQRAKRAETGSNAAELAEAFDNASTQL